MYFVKLWITISAPNLTGETEKRESYQQLILNYVLILINQRSATSNNGLLTVSQYKTFVSGVMAASTASSLVISTNVVLISLGVKFLEKHMFLHKLFYLIRCGLQRRTTASRCVIAPIPEADTFAVSLHRCCSV
jgi:hypothetical protein